MKNSVAIGLRAKTARAIVVVLGGSAESPIVLLKEEIRLVDSKVPGTAQPYHEVMDLRWEESQRKVQKFARAIESIATKELARLIKQMTKDGTTIVGAGIVGAKDRDLARIGNNHIRAHAAEGVLFRSVLEFAAEKNGLPRRAFSDRDFATITKAELGQKYASVAQRIDDLRRSVSPPWRTDEKQAALAAWLVLNGK
jgi:hypothetical protein